MCNEIRTTPDQTPTQERTLDYSTALGWHIRTETFTLRMTDATFQRHVEAFLLASGLTEPTQEQRIQARLHCQAVSFWDGCEDPEVFRRLLPPGRWMPGPHTHEYRCSS